MLYYNKVLLQKYGKTIPETWDELIDTSKYILEKENNTNLIGYNGLFDGTYLTLYNIYIYVYIFTYINSNNYNFK